MENQLYDWSNLRQYVERRMRGDFIAEFEAQIQADDFLQTVVEGLEAELRAHSHQELTASLAVKKQKVWQQLSQSPLISTPEAAATNTNLQQPLLHPIKVVQTIWEELKYSQFHYLLGFNCSCVLLILGFCMWINVSHDEIQLLSQVEFPGGFKP